MGIFGKRWHLRWETWHMMLPYDGNHTHPMAPCDGQFFSHGENAMGNTGAQWHLKMGNLVHGCTVNWASLAHDDTLRWATWHTAMGILGCIGTLRWATWQLDAPRDGQHGTIRHIALDNLTMALCDGQFSTQWHHLTGNYAHNDPMQRPLLAHCCTTRWAT